MDDMDIDFTLDVPDTPDRLIAQTSKGRRNMERGKNLTASGHSGHCNHFADDAKNGLKASDKESRKLLIQASKCGSTNYGSRSNSFASGNPPSSSSNNSLIFRRSPSDTSNYENKRFQPTDDNKVVGHVVDLAGQNGHVQVGKRDNPCIVRGNSRMQGSGKVHLSTSRLPSSSGMSSSVMTLHNGNTGKEPTNKASSIDCDDAIGSLSEAQPKMGKFVSTSLNSVSLPKVTRQKRLVRNGCISPYNIAKAKKEVGTNKSGDIDVGPRNTLPMVSGASRIGLTESTTEQIDSHKSKGKGIMMSHPLPVEESDTQNTHTRNSVSIDEMVKEVGVEEFGGWRSMRNRSKKMNLSVSDDDQHLSGERDDPRLVSWPPKNGVTGRKIGKDPETTNNFPMSQDQTSGQSASLLPPRHRLSDDHQHLSGERDEPRLVSWPPKNGVTRRKIGNDAETTNNFPMSQDQTSGQSASLLPPRHRLSNQPLQDQRNHSQAARNMLTKRQRQESSLSSLGESSSAALGDPDIMFLGSSGNTSRSTPNRSRNSLEPIIEIDESSPEVRGDGFSAPGGSATGTDAMASQIEADEILARELQEQFYNEVPSVGVGEDDMYMAATLQPVESPTRAFPRRSQHVFNPRNSLTSSSTRQSQPRSSLNVSRRSSQTRGATFNRMGRLRSRFPGRPRTISSSSSSSSSSRERSTVFPPDMDVDMRMYILEALEAFSDMGVDNNFLQMHREFNENDYEMLLALDENNHLHGGSTDHQINGLPQSTVQSDNYEEGCAICLETPTIGDIIRHLPCLHKFHKDCIDPWLRRKTSCPVCKSSIT